MELSKVLFQSFIQHEQLHDLQPQQISWLHSEKVTAWEDAAILETEEQQMLWRSPGGDDAACNLPETYFFFI